VKKMNANIITPGLAKVVGLETKQCFAVIKEIAARIAPS